jgi:hypothetical protein
VFCFKTRFRGCLLLYGYGPGIFRPAKAAFAALQAFLLGRTAANGATAAQMNFGMWCIQLARVGFPGRAHRLTGLGSTAGALSRLLIQQARRFGFCPYIRAGLRRMDSCRNSNSLSANIYLSEELVKRKNKIFFRGRAAAPALPVGDDGNRPASILRFPVTEGK